MSTPIKNIADREALVKRIQDAIRCAQDETGPALILSAKSCRELLAALSAQGGEQSAESAAIKPCPACSAPMRVCSHCEGDGYEPGTDNDVTGPSLCHECNGIGGKYLQQTAETVIVQAAWWVKIKEALGRRFPRCRGCADDGPICPDSGLPCRLDDMLAAAKEGK